MVEHTIVSRKTTDEDRIAICPQFGCEFIKRIKPLKFGFLGFGKYPRCKYHYTPLVYLDERIGEVVDGAIACLFDKSGLLPKSLLTLIKQECPEEYIGFINNWVYCITIGRGAKIIAKYMRILAETYLKQLTNKQLKALKNDTNNLSNAIKRGIDEIALQFERLLKHLRAHSEVLVNINELSEPSSKLREILNTWLELSEKEVEELLDMENKNNIPLSQVKNYYDKIINLGICKCLLGLPPIDTNLKKRKLTAFDRFSAYHEFWREHLTEKFTKSDINALKSNNQKISKSVNLSNEFKLDNLEILTSKNNFSAINVMNTNGSKYKKHYFTGLKGISRLRLKISLYFFKLIRNSGIEISKLISLFKKNILDNINLPKELTLEEREILIKMVKHKDFDKYFSDLAHTIVYLINSSILHKKIGAKPKVSHIAKALKKKNINLFHSQNVFPMTLTDIYDYLKSKYDDFFPERGGATEFTTQEKKKRWKKDIKDSKIIGAKIKIYIIENIYNGRYIRDGKAQCPRCVNEKFIINTDISRLEALEFHHEGVEKAKEYTVKQLFLLFQSSFGDPDFLEKLILKMESENIELICSNHHNLIHADYYNIFKHLINWEDIFSLESILINSLIRVSVNSYAKKRKYSMYRKNRIRYSIKAFIQKRYILEKLYNNICPICREINSKYFLPSFDFHHLDPENKTIEASSLFRSDLSCSEIVKKLEEEQGIYTCKNCHSVCQDPNSLDVIQRIYDDKAFVRKIIEDVNRCNKRTILLRYIPLIGAPLQKEFPLFDANLDYLFAIDEIISYNQEASNKLIANHLNVTNDAVRSAMRNPFFTPFIDVYYPYVKAEKFYTLTDYGKKALDLLRYFRDYYTSD